MGTEMLAKKILVCTHRRLSPLNPSCAGRGSIQLLEQLKAMCDLELLDITIETIDCFGRCDHGPNVRIAPGGEFFQQVTEDDIPMIIKAFKEYG